MLAAWFVLVRFPRAVTAVIEHIQRAARGGRLLALRIGPRRPTCPGTHQQRFHGPQRPPPTRPGLCGGQGSAGRSRACVAASVLARHGGGLLRVWQHDDHGGRLYAPHLQATRAADPWREKSLSVQPLCCCVCNQACLWHVGLPRAPDAAACPSGSAGMADDAAHTPSIS